MKLVPLLLPPLILLTLLSSVSPVSPVAGRSSGRSDSSITTTAFGLLTLSRKAVLMGTTLSANAVAIHVAGTIPYRPIKRGITIVFATLPSLPAQRLIASARVNLLPLQTVRKEEWHQHRTMKKKTIKERGMGGNHWNQRVTIAHPMTPTISPPSPMKARPAIMPSWNLVATESAKSSCPVTMLDMVPRRTDLSPKRWTAGPAKNGRTVLGTA